MDNSSLIMLGILGGGLIVAMVVPVLLRWRWLAVFLPWVIPLTKSYLEAYVPITRAVDISVVTFGLLGLFLLAGFLSRRLVWDRRYTVLLLLHLAVAGTLALSYTWTSAPNYGGRKLGLFAIFNTICLLVGVSTVESTADAKKMAKGFSLLVLLISVWILVAPTYMYGERWQLRQTFAETSPLNVAFALGVGSLCSLVWVGGGKRRVWLTVVIWLVSLVATYRTGSRAMVGQIILGTVMLALMFKGSHRAIRTAAVVLLVAGGLVWVLSHAAQVESRFFRFFQDPAYWFERSERPYLWAQAVKGASQRPFFGHGVGAFAVNVLGADVRNFPHNFFLEVLYEGGLVCFTLFTLFWILVYYYLFSWRRANNQYADFNSQYVQDLWIAVFVASGLASVLHWDISGQRLLWLLAGIALGVARACNLETMWDREQGPCYVTEEGLLEPLWV